MVFSALVVSRHIHMGWQHDQFGRWVSDREDEAQWEVVCVQCGDDEGPADWQTPGVQRLCGPYPSRHKARHAAGRHEAETNVPTRGIPGSAVPFLRAERSDEAGDGHVR